MICGRKPTKLNSPKYCYVSKQGCLFLFVEGHQKAPFSIAATPKCRGVLLLFLGCSTLPLIRTLYCWVLSREVSSTIFKVFGMTRPGIEPRSPGPLANTLSTKPMSRYWVKYQSFLFKQLNYQTFLFRTIEFSNSPLFAVSLHIKQFYSTQKYEPIRCYHSGSE